MTLSETRVSKWLPEAEEIGVTSMKSRNWYDPIKYRAFQDFGDRSVHLRGGQLSGGSPFEGSRAITKFLIATLPMLVPLFLWSAMALAQSSNILIPYGMGAGMQLMNRALQPRPSTAPTPTSEASYGCSNR